MTRSLPPKPSLEQLKNQAKDLLRAYRAQDPQATHRVQMHLGPAQPRLPVTLASARHILAREYGFTTWPALKQHVESTRQGEEQQCQQLAQQVERLGSRDWRVVLLAEAGLAQTGDAGLEAVLAGCSHPHPPVRRGCVEFLRRHATDRHVPVLRRIALNDPVPSVRLAAVHAIGYRRCKAFSPGRETIEILSHIALADDNLRVRHEAVSCLGLHPPDARAAAPLRTILETPSDRMLQRLAHLALKHHCPEYRAVVDARARDSALARAQAQERETATAQS